MDHALTVWLMTSCHADLDVAAGPSWRERAACAGMDEAVFFPSKGEPGTTAKQVCQACPVAGDCLEFALEFEADTVNRFGVWGGMSPGERVRLSRQAA
jgi:WhiB family transcriptional regulator, redox-sensing transcriptional regulator